MYRLLFLIIPIISVGYFGSSDQIHEWSEIRPIAIPRGSDTTFTDGAKIISVEHSLYLNETNFFKEKVPALKEIIEDTLTGLFRHREFYSDTTLCIEYYYYPHNKYYKKYTKTYTLIDTLGHVMVSLNYDTRRIDQDKVFGQADEFNKLVDNIMEDFKNSYGNEISKSIALDLFSSTTPLLNKTRSSKLRWYYLDFNLRLMDGIEFPFQRVNCDADSMGCEWIHSYSNNLPKVNIGLLEIKRMCAESGFNENIEPYDYEIVVDTTKSTISLQIRSLISRKKLSKTSFITTKLSTMIDLTTGVIGEIDTLEGQGVVAY